MKQEIARIEAQNEGKELRLWLPNACPAAKEHWHRVQQRIWLESKGKRGPKDCCEELGLPRWPTSEKQRKALDEGREKFGKVIDPP